MGYAKETMNMTATIVCMQMLYCATLACMQGWYALRGVENLSDDEREGGYMKLMIITESQGSKGERIDGRMPWQLIRCELCDKF